MALVVRVGVQPRKDQMADEKKAKLEALKDDLRSQEARLIEDYMNTAVVTHLLAPIRHEIALLEGELSPEDSTEESGDTQDS